MLLTRRFRIGVVVLVLGGLVAGTAAVASLGNDEPSSAARAAGAGDTMTGEASKSKAPTSTSRAVPADAGAPVAVEPAPVTAVAGALRSLRCGAVARRGAAAMSRLHGGQAAVGEACHHLGHRIAAAPPRRTRGILGGLPCGDGEVRLGMGHLRGGRARPARGSRS